MASTTFNQWFAAYQKQNPDAKIDANTRNLFWYWRYKQGDPVQSSLSDPTFQSYMAGRGITVTSPSSGTGDGGGGAGTTGGDKPPTATGNTVTRMDAGQEADIIGLYKRLFALPEFYNPQRKLAAENTRGTLLDQGYYDTVGMSQSEAPSLATKTGFEWANAVDPKTGQPSKNSGGFNEQFRNITQTPYGPGETKPQGDITYKLKLGPDGRLYRQAYMKVADTMAARGVYSSSLINDTNRQNQQNLDTSRDSIIRGLDTTTFNIGQQQIAAANDINSAIGSAVPRYAQYQADNPAMIPGVTNVNGTGVTGLGTGTTAAPSGGGVPSGTTTSPATSSTTATTGSTAGSPGVTPTPATTVPVGGQLGSWTQKAAGANATPRLQKAVRARNKGVSFKIVRRGNRYVAVRTK